jgi:hypothetical protein
MRKRSSDMHWVHLGTPAKSPSLRVWTTVLPLPRRGGEGRGEGEVLQSRCTHMHLYV